MPGHSPNVQLEGGMRAEFEAMFRANYGFVHHLLGRLGVRSAWLDDVASEVFLVVWRKFGDWDRARPIKPWLFGISMRVAADHNRLGRNRFEIAVERSPAVASGGVAQTEAQELVMRALDTLQNEQRVVFVACDIEGLTAPECAELTGAPLNTVYSRLRLARAQFVAAVRELNATERRTA